MFFVFLWEVARYRHKLTMIIMLQIIIEYKETAILTFKPHCDRYRATRETTPY